MAGSGTSHLRDDDPSVVLSVQGLVVEYRSGLDTVQAVSDVSFDVAEGEVLGIVGESGCGKSSTGRGVMMLPPPTRGRVLVKGVEWGTLGARKLRRARPDVQLIFQDPASSLNPRRTVRQIVAEGLSIHGRPERRDPDVIDDLLRSVGIDPGVLGDRRPHELSGGQCQRVALARALALEPSVLICDEAVSALDVSVQAQILNLLEEARRRYGLALIFIAHDLAVVKQISDRVAVMYLGKLCEVAPSEDLYRSPAHPYTEALLRSIPVADPDAELAELALSGELPSPLDPPSGCRFRTHCPRADATCAEVEPTMRTIGIGHHVACHHPTVG